MVAQPRRRWTEAEYLEYERAQAEKNEFHDGEVLLMAGASPRHNQITGNTYRSLADQLDDRPCGVYINDLRVAIADQRRYVYPDVLVVCGEEVYSDEQQDTLTNPTLIVEVLSSSTERYDRGEKFETYRAIASLQEYVLISQERPVVERFLRQPNGQWLFASAAGLEAVVALESIGVRLPLAEVYRRVGFEGEG